MHFDHLEGKKFIISKWWLDCLNYQILFDEIKKCDLVCANCHAIRTYIRAKEKVRDKTSLIDFKFFIQKFTEKMSTWKQQND